MLKAWCRAKERQINSKKSTGRPRGLCNFIPGSDNSLPHVKKHDVQKEYRVRLGRKNRETPREDICAACVGRPEYIKNEKEEQSCCAV